MKRLLAGIILVLFAGIAGASPLGLDRIYPVQQKDFESFQQKFNSNFGYSVDKNFNKLELTLNPILTGYSTGDILYASSTSSLAKLNIGSAGQHLVSRGGIPSWEALPSSGTVTQVNAGSGLTGGPITTTGTISIDTTVVATSSSGTYTPTLYNITNVSASTAYACIWTRTKVGTVDVVTVYFKADIDPINAAPTATEVDFTLPVSCSTTPVVIGCAGCETTLQVAKFGGVSSTRGYIAFLAQTTANVGWGGSYQYVVN